MIRIALPNKGRIAESARELLKRAGLKLEFRGERALQARLGNDLLALFVRAADIPAFVADGAADLGITGRDLDRVIADLRELGGVGILVTALAEVSINSAAIRTPAFLTEAADLIYHALVACRALGVDTETVLL